jgi:uncharacterized alpha-E superfamily protein
MLSRVADSLFWMSRYLERAENTSRLLDVNLYLQLDRPGSSTDPTAWAPLLAISADEPAYRARYGEIAQENVYRWLTFETRNPNSILSCLTTARNNARAAREQISTEMWEQLNRLYLFIRGADAEAALRAPHDLYAQVRRMAQAFEGTTAATLTHDEGSRFIDLGKFLERGDMTTRLLDMKAHVLLAAQDVGRPLDVAQWMAILKSVSAYEAYRRRFHADIEADKVVGFILFDETFPRSLLFSVARVEDALQRALEGATVRGSDSRADDELRREVGRLHADLRFTEAKDVMGGSLSGWLDTVQARLIRITQAITGRFFRHRLDAAYAGGHQQQQ